MRVKRSRWEHSPVFTCVPGDDRVRRIERTTLSDVGEHWTRVDPHPAKHHDVAHLPVHFNIQPGTYKDNYGRDEEDEQQVDETVQELGIEEELRRPGALESLDFPHL